MEDKYVSERIVNIKDLEKIISEARYITASLLHNAEKGTLENASMKKRLSKLDVLLHEAEEFDFCIERRTTCSRQKRKESEGDANTNGVAEHCLLYYFDDCSDCMCCDCKKNEASMLETSNCLDCS